VEAGGRTEEHVAFEALFDGSYLRCVAVARRIVGDGPLAEEMASEAFARAWARWRSVRGHPCPSAWVLRTTSNLALDLARRGLPPAAPTAQPTSEADVVVLRVALAHALRGLARRQRDTIVLRYLAGLPEHEVAVALGISDGSVKTHLHRGLARLRIAIGPDDRPLETIHDA